MISTSRFSLNRASWLSALAAIAICFASSAAQASARVYLDQKTKTVQMKSHLLFYGGAVTPKIVQDAVTEIDTYWNGKTHDPEAAPIALTVSIGDETYAFRLVVTHEILDPSLTPDQVKAMAAADKNPMRNYIRLEVGSAEDSDRSYITYLYANTGTWYLSNDLGRSTTAAHEFGHILGLDHHGGDLRGEGQPGIMVPRGTLVDPEFQWDPSAEPDVDEGGSVSPYTRRVIQADIDALNLGDRFPALKAKE